MIDIVNFILPQCDGLRKKWVVKQLKKLPKNSTLLDAGAGECQYKKHCSHLKYVSQDFGKYDGKGDNLGIQTGTRDSSKINIVSDITNIPVKSSSFDNVLCIEVFEHIPRPLDAIAELSRVLKKGGTLILTAPFSSLTHYSPYYFYSGFSLNFYKENLPRYGFKIKEVYTYGNYFDHVSLELARTPLIIFRKLNIFALPLLVLYSLSLPIYILLRLLSISPLQPQGLFYFGHGIRAIKI